MTRILFCYSRDRAVPLPWLWSKIHKPTRSPLAALWVSAHRQRPRARHLLRACDALPPPGRAAACSPGPPGRLTSLVTTPPAPFPKGVCIMALMLGLPILGSETGAPRNGSTLRRARPPLVHGPTAPLQPHTALPSPGNQPGLPTYPPL